MAIEENHFDHILYEFYMYLKACTTLGVDQFETNLRVDSREIHLRNLIYFFNETKQGKCMHYRTYIQNRLPGEIDRKTFNLVQNVTCNGTCHMQEGRLNPEAKKNALKVETDIFPRMCELIIKFIREMYRSCVPDYMEQWSANSIQFRTVEILELINSRKNLVVETATTE